jgi:hypothetical protein
LEATDKEIKDVIKLYDATGAAMQNGLYWDTLDMGISMKQLVLQRNGYIHLHRRISVKSSPRRAMRLRFVRR